MSQECSCGHDHEQIRAMCKKSLFFTARFLGGFDKMTVDFHGRLANWVESHLRSNNRRLMVLTSRIFYKTSLLTKAGVLWFIINRPDVSILIMQASAQKATDVMNHISLLLHSERFAHYFPELVPDKTCRDNSEEIDVPTHPAHAPTISARGINSKVTGGHYDIHILDDIIDETIMESEIEMERAIRWFKGSAPLFTSGEHGIRIVIGTRWSLNDLYQYVKDAGTHQVWELGCYSDDRSGLMGFEIPHGQSLFPEQYPNKVLDVIREDMNDSVFFSYQFLNIPIVPGLKRFTDEMIHYFNWVEYGKRIVIDGQPYSISDFDVSITVDPSLGATSESDLFAVVVAGWSRRNAIGVILDVFADRLDPTDQAAKVFDTWKKWNSFGYKVQHVGIERAGYQWALASWVKELQRQRDAYFWIQPLDPGGQRKTKRIDSLQPYFKNGQIYVQRSQGDLIKQLIGYQPKADGSTGLKHDDIIDALAYHTTWWLGSTVRPRAPEATEEDLEDWTTRPQPKDNSLYGLNMEG